MSRESKRNNSVNTEVKEARVNKEDKFRIINEEPAEFPCVGKVDYKRSLQFCSDVTKIFKEVYDDFYGTTFEISQSGESYICLWFDHNISNDSDKIVAFSQYDNGDTSASNEVLNRVRSLNRRARSGNQYKITKFGREGLDEFIKDRIIDGSMVTNLRNNKGKVIWERCAMDVAEPQQHYNAQQAQKVFSKVSYIDPAKMYKLIYGESVISGVDITTGKDIVSKVEYKIEVVSSVGAPNGYNKDFLLKIEQINQDELNRILHDIGVGSYSPFGIVNG